MSKFYLSLLWLTSFLLPPLYNLPSSKGRLLEKDIFMGLSLLFLGFPQKPEHEAHLVCVLLLNIENK